MTHSTPQIRPAAVAGMFYPGSSSALARDLQQMLSHTPPASGLRPKAIIAPHAGYVYSGPIAASVYAPLADLRESIRRVILLGPTHRVAVDGLALPSSRAFATPLGVVQLDQEAMASIEPLPQVIVSDAAHALEHSLEVQLPFLQTVLSGFTLLPLAVGRASAAEVAEVLECLWGGDETLIVISSDLSHSLRAGPRDRQQHRAPHRRTRCTPRPSAGVWRDTGQWSVAGRTPARTAGATAGPAQFRRHRRRPVASRRLRRLQFQRGARTCPLTPWAALC